MTYHIVVENHSDGTSTIDVRDVNNKIVHTYKEDYHMSSVYDLHDVIGTEYSDYDRVTGLKEGDYERFIKVEAINKKCDCCESCSMINNVEVIVYVDGYEKQRYDVTDMFSTWGIEDENDINEALANTPYSCYDDFSIKYC